MVSGSEIAKFPVSMSNCRSPRNGSFLAIKGRNRNTRGVLRSKHHKHALPHAVEHAKCTADTQSKRDHTRNCAREKQEEKSHSNKLEFCEAPRLA